jgi:hypothetical protein
MLDTVPFKSEACELHKKAITPYRSLGMPTRLTAVLALIKSLTGIVAKRGASLPFAVPRIGGQPLAQGVGISIEVGYYESLWIYRLFHLRLALLEPDGVSRQTRLPAYLFGRQLVSKVQAPYLG